MNYDINEGIDIKENALVNLDPKILKILLKDKSKEYEKQQNKNDKIIKNLQMHGRTKT